MTKTCTLCFQTLNLSETEYREYKISYFEQTLRLLPDCVQNLEVTCQFQNRVPGEKTHNITLLNWI